MALVNRDFQPLSLAEYKGKWVALVFYPLDFTFVCPTELVGLNDKHAEFAQRNCEIVAASTDSVYSHLGWVKADSRLGALKYPLLSDFTKKIARDYGVLIEDEGVALRGTFIIDPEGVLRFMMVNDLGTGRNIDEMLRTLDALQTGELCPCNWKAGEATIPE
jgi:peroxiredoxin (alkyl hydroperoxide reductase subunit C)